MHNDRDHAATAEYVISKRKWRYGRSIRPGVKRQNNSGVAGKFFLGADGY